MTAVTMHVSSAQQLTCFVQVRPAYLVLDAFHHGQVGSHMSVTKIMADSEYLRECQDLFELYVSDYIMLTRCKVRLRLFIQAQPAISSKSTLFCLGLESAKCVLQLASTSRQCFSADADCLTVVVHYIDTGPCQHAMFIDVCIGRIHIDSCQHLSSFRSVC